MKRIVEANYIFYKRWLSDIHIIYASNIDLIVIALCIILIVPRMFRINYMESVHFGRIGFYIVLILKEAVSDHIHVCTVVY